MEEGIAGYVVRHRDHITRGLWICRILWLGLAARQNSRVHAGICGLVNNRPCLGVRGLSVASREITVARVLRSTSSARKPADEVLYIF